jgi:hypothetical protein
VRFLMNALRHENSAALQRIVEQAALQTGSKP